MDSKTILVLLSKVTMTHKLQNGYTFLTLKRLRVEDVLLLCFCCMVKRVVDGFTFINGKWI